MLLLTVSLCDFFLVKQVLVDVQDLRGRALVLVHLQEDAVGTTPASCQKNGERMDIDNGGSTGMVTYGDVW